MTDSLDQDYERPPSRFEYVAAATGLAVFSGAVLSRLGGSTASDTGNAASIAAQALVGFAAAAALLSRRRPGALRIDPWLFVLLVIAAVSLTQSVTPGVGIRRIAAAVAFSVFGVYLADRFERHELLLLIVTAIGLAAVLSALAAIVAPSYGHMPGGDSAWRGVFQQKNVLARAMALGCVAGVYAATGRGSARLKWVVVATVAVMGIDLVQARSSFAPVAIAVALAPLLLRVARRLSTRTRGSAVAFVAAGAVTLWAVVVAHGGLIAFVGKDPSLNGRAPLWTSVVHAISQHPWLGYGYGTFWRGWSAPSTMVMLENVWGPPHAHNGLLDMALGVGLLGAAVWLMILARGVLAGVGYVRRQGDAQAWWPVGFLLLLLAYNVFEVTTTSNALFWALFVAVTCSARAVPDVHPAPAVVARPARPLHPWRAVPSSAR